MHPFKTTLINTLEKVRNNKYSGSGDLPLQTYEILLDRASDGKCSVTSVYGSKLEYDKLKQGVLDVPDGEPRLDPFNKAIDIARKHRLGIKDKLSGKGGPLTRAQRDQIIVNYYAQQTAFTIIAASSPQELLGRDGFLEELGTSVLNHDITADKNLSSSLTGMVNTATQRAGSVLPENSTALLVNKAVNTLRPRTGFSVDPLTLSLALLTTLALKAKGQPEETNKPVEKKWEPEEPVSPPLSGMFLGIGFWGFLALKGKKGEDEFEEEAKKETAQNETNKTEGDKTAAPDTSVKLTNTMFEVVNKPLPAQENQPLPASSGTTVSTGLNIIGGLGNLKRLFLGSKGIGGVADLATTVLSGGTTKLAALGLKLLMFLGGPRSDTGQPDLGSAFKTVLLIPIYVIGGVLALGMFIMMMKSAALVAPINTGGSSSTSTATASGSPQDITTPAIPAATTQPFPTRIPGLSGDLPGGFPLDNSCVTQVPNQGTHSTNHLNAIDIGNISEFGSWVAKSTHAGKVILISADFDNYGQIVVVEALDKRYITYYAHLEYGSIKVSTGDQVTVGTELGTVDNTGYSSGSHLHYELRGPSDDFNSWGSQTGPFGQTGTILNFLPDKSTWACGGNL